LKIFTLKNYTDLLLKILCAFKMIIISCKEQIMKKIFAWQFNFIRKKTVLWAYLSFVKGILITLIALYFLETI